MEASAKRDPRGQGSKGEINAAFWFLGRGIPVFIPLLHSPRDFDLIADIEGVASRIQVKTSKQLVDGRWRVSVCTRGGNRSWNGLVKYLDPARYDFLFVVVGDGRRWLIPSFEIDGRTSINVGSEKYEKHEIDRGAPL